MWPTKVSIQKTGRKINLLAAHDQPWFGGWQTILGVINYTRNTVTTCKVEQFQHTKSMIEWTNIPQNDKDNKKTLLIFPGLTGGVKDNYVISTIKTMQKYNYKIGVFRYSLLSNQIKQGRIRVMDEVQEVLKQLKHQQPQRQISCVGFSNGANQILHYVGKSGKQCVVNRLMVISCPFDILKSSQLISPMKSRLLTMLTLRSVQPVKDKFVGYQLDWKSIKQSKTLKQFDDRFSRIVCEYDTVQEYYRETSSSKYADNIQIPVLALHSKDDSFCPVQAIPTNCQKISFLLTSKGGHNAFVTWRFQFWFLKPLEQFFTRSINSLYKK